MAYRQTFVIEYPDPSHAPAVGAGMQMLGGELIAVQFDDALEELEAPNDCIATDDQMRAQRLRDRMRAERTA